MLSKNCMQHVLQIKKRQEKCVAFLHMSYYDSRVNTNEINCEYCVLLFAILRASTVVCVA